MPPIDEAGSTSTATATATTTAAAAVAAATTSSPLSSPSTSSASSAAPSPTPKKRKPKKRFLSLGKDPTGKWKRRRKEQEDREIQRALSSADTGPDADADDILESIHVAGGFLMIGNGSANPPTTPPPPPPPRKRKRPSTATRTTAAPPKQLLLTSSSPVNQFAAATSTTSSSLSEPDENENDDELFAALASPGSKISPATTLPAEPPPPPSSPPQQQQQQQQTIFHVYRFPELTPTLSTHAPGFGDRVLLDWTRLLTSQAELDQAIVDGGVYELAVSDPTLPEIERARWSTRVKERKEVGRKRGHEEFDEAFMAPPASRWRSADGEPEGSNTTMEMEKADDVEGSNTTMEMEKADDVEESAMEIDSAVEIEEKAAEIEIEDSTVEIRDTAVQAETEVEKVQLNTNSDLPATKNMRPAGAEPAIGGKITLAGALRRQRELRKLHQGRVRGVSEGEKHEKGKEKGKAKNHVIPALLGPDTDVYVQKPLRAASAPAGTVAQSAVPLLREFHFSGREDRARD